MARVLLAAVVSSVDIERSFQHWTTHLWDSKVQSKEGNCRRLEALVFLSSWLRAKILTNRKDIEYINDILNAAEMEFDKKKIINDDSFTVPSLTQLRFIEFNLTKFIK